MIKKINNCFSFYESFKIDALRRKHIYDEFIVTYLNVLSESGKLIELIQNNGYLSTNGSTINSSNNSTHAAHASMNGSTSKSIYFHSASKKLKKK
jgi:hypothetical protein